MFSQEYFELMEKSHQLSKTHNVGYISVSTMTFIATLSCTVNIDKLTKNFQSCEYPVCTLKKTKNHHEYTLTKRGKKKLSFYNQITINYTDHTTKSIKVFSNGRLQMTGITSMNEARYAANVVIDILSSIEEYEERPHAKQFDIVLVNSNFSFKNSLNIIKIKSMLDRNIFKVEYKPDVYPGLKIKHTNGASIFLFSTGNVVITGVKSIRHVREAFEHIVEQVNIDYESLKLPLSQPIKKRKNILYKHGYKVTEHDSCVC